MRFTIVVVGYDDLKTTSDDRRQRSDERERTCTTAPGDGRAYQMWEMNKLMSPLHCCS